MKRGDEPVSGIILAGGNSRRMGVNKLLLPWGEGTLLSNTVSVLQSRVSDIRVVGDNSVRQISAKLGIHFLPDETRSGPLLGILKGLQTALYDMTMVSAADLPFINPDAIDSLIRLSNRADVTVIRTEDGAHPLFGIYRKTCIPSIQSLLDAGYRKVTGFWSMVDAQIIDVGKDGFWNNCLFNINTPDDYHRAVIIHKSSQLPVTSDVRRRGCLD